AVRAATLTQRVPGVVVMAANNDGIIYDGAFGSRHLGQAPALTRDTVFRIASMIKVVTSVAAMQLVEQGKIELDAPAPAIDPALASPQVLTGFDPVGAPKLRRASLLHCAIFSPIPPHSLTGLWIPKPCGIP